MKLYRVLPLLGLLTLAALVGLAALPSRPAAAAPAWTGAGAGPQVVTSTIYLPYLVRPLDNPPYTCPTTSGNSYYQNIVYQQEYDWPVRPAYNHADKNYSLRGYVLNTADAKSLISGISDPNEPHQPPQLGTIFNPDRVTSASARIANVYWSYLWTWGTSPDPGTRGGVDTNPAVGSVGLLTTPGEVLETPTSYYEIAFVGGVRYQAFVIYADADTIAIHYTAEDTAGQSHQGHGAGYTVHVDGICTDPNLLALYNQLDDPNGPRYSHRMLDTDPWHSFSYPMPYLALGQAFGTARGTEIRMKIIDSGSTLDPRQCWNFWHWTAPGVNGSCN